MNRKICLATLASVCGLALPALAQPTITAVGSGTPTKATNGQGGTIYVGGSSGTGAARWALTGNNLALTIAGGTAAGTMSADGAYMTGAFLNASPQPRISGNTATGVSPAFSLTPTLVASTAQPTATESYGARWNALTNVWQFLPGLPGTGTSPADMVARALYVFGSGGSGGSSGNFLSPNAISADGRFVVGQGYISTYNSAAGTTISANSFQWRPWIWDANTNAMTVLPTPRRTSSNTYRFRTGNPYAVSADGLIVVGAQEHNVGTTPTADPDGGRLVVWRFDTGTSNWVMSYLPAPLNSAGLVQTSSTSPGTVHMNPAGTIIVGKAITTDTPTEPSQVFLAKWVWNPATSTWNNPINIGTNLTTDASWLPQAVTSCSANQPRANPTFDITGMSDDGNVLVGAATYSTCGSFMRGGFIWTNTDDGIMDWYDYNVAQGTPGITTAYGPIGDLGDPNKGLPRAGNPLGISPDGNTIVGAQGGTQIIVDAPRWIMQRSNGATCVPAAVSANPPATAVFNRCGTFPIVNRVRLTATPSGTLPILFRWSKDGVALVDGPTANGSIISGATTFEFVITNPVPQDAGNYTCTFTGCDGASVTTTACAVTADTTTPAAPNQSPATAATALLGATNFNPCGAFLSDGFSVCTPTGTDSAPMWFRYVPTFTGTARIQTCGSNYDTTLSAYTADLSVIECNNDVGSRGLVGTTCSSTRSLISRIAVTNGTPIYIRVGAAFTAGTTGVLTITQNPAPAPANDLCENAQTVGIGAFPFNLSEATDELTVGTDGCSGAGGFASNRDIWYRINAPFGANITIDTCGPTTNMSNPMLHIYDACGGTILACNDSFAGTGCTGGSQQARISNFVFTGSVLVRLAASGTGVPNNGGIGTLNITGSIFAPCSPADIVGAGGASDLPPGDGILDGSDFTAFVNAFSADDLLADINHDGIVDGGDFIAFINAFGAGC